jgi:hypothetical protein
MGNFVGEDDFITNGGSNIGLCGMNFSLEVAAISVFFIMLAPSFISCYNETLIVLFSKRVCYNNEDDEGHFVSIFRLYASDIHRKFIWIFVNLAEIIILVSTLIVGIKFM